MRSGQRHWTNEINKGSLSMSRVPVSRNGPAKGKTSGFSLIEVMVAILVLGLGLLGFALLQTMSVRFTQSANQRTQATHLAYDMLDQIRANRLAVAQYAGNYAATATGCAPDATITSAKYKVIWQCRLGLALGAGASAVVSYDNGVATVAITWADERWNDANKDGVVSADESDRSISARTRL
jgi:type IV pilus assembly protein PilV